MQDWHERLGQRLGSGGSKTAFTIKDDPTKVLLVTYESYPWLAEKQMLDKMTDMGLPVLKVYDSYKPGDGNLYIVCDRYKTGSKDGQDNVVALTNDRTIASSDQIDRACKKHGIYYISDYQFLWHQDGHIVIADPGSLQINKTEFNRLDKNGTLFYRSWQAAIEFAWQIKHGLVHEPYSWGNAKAWWDREGKDHAKVRRVTYRQNERKEEAFWAANGLMTVHHHWVDVEDLPKGA